jgi:phage terminase large subunit-like protein
MNPATINDTTFLLTGPLGSVAGLVTYDEFTSTATFTPAVDLGKLTQYTVTVTTGAESLSGVPMAADFTSTFTTRDGAWGAAQMIEDNTGDANEPQVVVDPSGNAVAIWYQWDGSNYTIYSNRYDALSGMWGTAQAIESNTGGAYDPQVAIDLDGNAVAIWYQRDGSNYTIYSNRYDALSGMWGTAQAIESNTGGAYDPQVAIDSSGNAVAVWYRYDGSYWSIYSNRYDALSDMWGTAQAIEGNTGHAYYPQVAVDPDGNAVAVWTEDDGGNYNIYSNRYDALSCTWGTAQAIEGNTGNAYYPQVAVDPDGNAVAVWYQWDGTYYTIYSNRYDALSGTWGTVQAIESNTRDAFAPQVAVDPDGNATVVWCQEDGTYYTIYSNRYDAVSGTWGTAQAIEGNTLEAASPQVAVDLDGNAVAVWNQWDGTYYTIYSNRYNAALGTWGTAQAIEGNAEDAYYPQVAVDPMSNAVAVWLQFDNDGIYYSIWANWFR